MSAHPSLTDPAQARATDGVAYEQLVEAYAEPFRRYLQRVLDRQAEGRGGRIGVEDTLQDGLLCIFERWPELQGLDRGERDRRMYRCVRDAAVRALRAEYGQRTQKTQRPRLIAYDFASMERVGDEKLAAPERELTAAVLGSMVRAIAEDQPGSEARAMLSRCMLLAGLRALTEREAVVLIAVDHLGWDQRQLAERLATDVEALRKMLFLARRIFYTVVRHATGVEVDEEERARLAAYRAGELTGAERRAVARHLKHCAACQALDAEHRLLGCNAIHLFGGLPFAVGAGVLTRARRTRRPALLVHGSGLFAQAGSARAAAIVMSVLGLGGGIAATLAATTHQPPHHRAESTTQRSTSTASPPAGMARIETPAPAPALSRPHTARQHHARRRRHTPSRPTNAPARPTTPTTSSSTTTTSSTPAAATAGPSGAGAGRGGQGCEFFCG